MSLADCYRSARISIHQAGRSRALLLSKEHNQVLEVDATVARLMSLCQGCKTLEGHAAAIARTGVAGDAHAVLATLQSLAMSGLLRSCADLLPAVGASPALPDVTPITTVAVITADRPRVLARGLESFSRHLADHGQAARLLVVDGSRDGAHQAANRQVVADLAGTTALAYVGAPEAAALRGRLSASGVPAATVDFALTPGAIGANRNLVLLLTTGEHVLMADDDIVCEPWSPQGGTGRLSVWGHNEPQDTEFFPSRADARHAASWAPVDLLAIHAATLGQTLPAALAAAGEPFDLAEACGHLLGALVEGRSPRVRATFSGIAGDAGTYCPYGRLFTSGPTHERMAASREVYDLALRSREVLRIASRTVITHDSRCMAGCMGLAAGEMVPPFMPSGRNEDGVFGAMLHAIESLSLFAHVPVGVVHDSDRSASYGDRSMKSASETRVSDVLMLVTRAAMMGTTELDSSSRLARLASVLTALGALDAPEFVTYATRLVLDSRALQLARVEVMVSRAAEYPPYWRSTLEEYRRTVVRSLARPDFFLPIEFQDAGGIEQGFGRLQRFVGHFGELLEAWPDMWREARARR